MKLNQAVQLLLNFCRIKLQKRISVASCHLLLDASFATKSLRTSPVSEAPVLCFFSCGSSTSSWSWRPWRAVTWHAMKKHDTGPAQFFPFVHDAKSGWPASSFQWAPNHKSYPWINCNKEEQASLPSVLQLFCDLKPNDQQNIAKAVDQKFENWNWCQTLLPVSLPNHLGWWYRPAIEKVRFNPKVWA